MTAPRTDHVGNFLRAYEEYLDGKRAYEDLPPAFGQCPIDPCGIVVCAVCHPGVAALWDASRSAAALLRIKGDAP